MPLKKGADPQIIENNIRELKNNGYSHEQAIAISLHTAHKSLKDKQKKTK